LDLHSGHSTLDPQFLADCCRELAEESGQPVDEALFARIIAANTGLEALQLAEKAGLDLPGAIARRARQTALATLRDARVAVEVLVVDRAGKVLARHG
jgi:cobalt-precorrin-5B (C1)-methyltransferase